MNLQMGGRRALITGASKGIGRATAELLATEACDVRLVARDSDALDEAVKAISSSTGRAVHGLSADLSCEADRHRAVLWAGEVDILVNNAGAIPAGSLVTLSDEVWR